jgi:hypothetical protein
LKAVYQLCDIVSECRCLKLLDQIKGINFSDYKINGDNLKKVICETSKTFKDKMECVEDKINEPETDSMNKNIRGV